ncbi:hypothetical protein BKA56DRAFT_459614, partial [Ilyonectria sp. MPI-CAGE-AT-0026]
VSDADFAPLERRPIALSIETKKPGEGWEGARLQLGVWQMGHWGFLMYLIEIQAEKRQARRAEVWDLVITTLDGAKTKFWHKLLMGNTLDTKGIYKLVCSLQILRTWAEESYWP